MDSEEIITRRKRIFQILTENPELTTRDIPPIYKKKYGDRISKSTVARDVQKMDSIVSAERDKVVRALMEEHKKIGRVKGGLVSSGKTSRRENGQYLPLTGILRKTSEGQPVKSKQKAKKR